MKFATHSLDPYRRILGRITIHLRDDHIARSQISTSSTPALTQPPPATPFQHVSSRLHLLDRVHDLTMWDAKPPPFSAPPGADLPKPQQPPPPVLSLAYMQTHPLSYVLTHPPFVLFSTIIALLVYVIVQERRHRKELGLLNALVRKLGRDGDLLVQALQINEERVERLGEGVDKVEDVVLEVSRCVREVLGGGARITTAMQGRGRSKEEGGRGPGVVDGDRDQGYDTVDEDAMTVRVEDDEADGDANTRYGYAGSTYTARDEDEDEDEDDADWETRTATTELEPRGRGGQWDGKRHTKKTWSKGDWKGLEVFG